VDKRRYNLQIVTCYRCSFSQLRRSGGCAGPCPCHIDGRDIIDHATLNYCPAGYYPFSGLGSALGWFFWNAGISRIWFLWKRITGTRCACAERAAALDRLGAWILNTLRGLWRILTFAKGRP
jgi:hypothetical protein